MWDRFKGRFYLLETWEKLTIFGLATICFIAVGAFANEDFRNPSKGVSVPTKQPSPSVSASPEKSQSTVATPTPTPTPSQTQTPETPLEFRFAALRDLNDLKKDVMDARKGISEDGLGKFYWNVAEIQFNISQLQSLMPREAYALVWNKNMETLVKLVEDLDVDDENLTITIAKAKLDRVLAAIPALEKVAKSLAN